MKSETHYVDRTGIEVDWLCGMKYWWNRVEGVRGVVPANQPAYFADGQDVHADLALVGKGVSADEVIANIPAPSSPNQDVWEAYARRIGWVKGVDMFIEPATRERYNTIHIEDEIVLDRSPLAVGVTPDRVLEAKDGSGLVYREYKSVRYATPAWVAHWPYAIQVHLGILALEEELKRPIKMGQVLGLAKGQEREGRLRHPYVWAYYKNGEWSPDYTYGWDLAPVWEREGGVSKWVVEQGEMLWRRNATWSAPIYLDRRLVEALIARRVVRQKEIEDNKEASRLSWGTRIQHFEQRFTECRPTIGDACPYLSACHNATVQDNILATGEYVPRTPHHELELILEQGGDDGKGD